MAHPIVEEFPNNPYIRAVGENVEFTDGEFWYDERDVCQHCLYERLTDGNPPNECEERDSMGVYAGRYCDSCWDRSGYIKGGYDEFDPSYAGEAYWEDDY